MTQIKWKTTFFTQVTSPIKLRVWYLNVISTRTLYFVLHLKNIFLSSVYCNVVSAEFSTPICNLLLFGDTSDSVSPFYYKWMTESGKIEIKGCELLISNCTDSILKTRYWTCPKENHCQDPFTIYQLPNLISNGLSHVKWNLTPNKYFRYIVLGRKLKLLSNDADYVGPAIMKIAEQ